MFKRFLLSVAAFLLALGWATPVGAAQFQAGESVIVPASQDDVYVAGSNVYSDGEIFGDLYAAGAIVRCDSDVRDDVVLAGSVVDLFGYVGDDARLAGSMVTVGGVVEDDLILFGAMVRILPGSVVRGDVTAMGGSVIIDGTVEGNVIGGGGQVMVNGVINGSAMLEADEVVFGSNANIAGMAKVKSPKEAKLDDAAKIGGGIEYEKLEEQSTKPAEPEASAGAIFGFGLIGFLIKVLIGLVTALIALYFFKKYLLELTKSMMMQFPAQLGWGFVWLIALPLASLILIFTIFGSTIGFFGLLVFGLVMVIAKTLAYIGFGSWLWKLFTKGKTYELDWKIVVLGVVVMNVIWLIPILGWLFCFVFVLAALGATFAFIKQSIKP
ncbi:MAG: hypothetical protein ACOYUZ_00170 [Patescibacteria group bacterium]